MRKLLGGLIFLSTLTHGQARFDRQLNIPVTEGAHVLRFPWAGGINFPKISSIDLNFDGSQDIFLFDNQNNRILTFLNNGNSAYEQAWDYSPQYNLQFPPVKDWAYLYDYDCDGRADLFTSSAAAGCAGITAYKNISVSGNPLQWILIDSCLDERYVTITQHIFTNAIALPHFNDIDGDGDMDILGYNTIPNGRILYHKNYSMENYGTCDSLDFVLESLCWGNFQLKIGGSNSVGCFHCPCRQCRPPDEGSRNYDDFFSAVDPQEPDYDPGDAARRDDTVSSIFAFDADGDNNMELLVGDIASLNTLLVHNGGVDMDTQDTLFPSYDTPALFNGFHYHSYLETDNDGRRDLLVLSNEFSNKEALWLYKNVGTAAVPVFSLETHAFLQGEMIDVGSESCPVLFDYDGDSLPDLVIGKSVFDESNGQTLTGLYLYRNNGTAANPSFDLVTDDFAGLTGLGLYLPPVYPAFGDLDGDGDLDMLLGLEDGRLHYFENTAGAGNPAVFSGPVANYMAIDVGKFATPQLYDLDRDGLLDIVCGSQRGFVNYFKNRGTPSAPLFDAVPTNDTLGCIVLQGTGTTDGFSVPFFYDSLGATRLLVAWEKGNIYQYNNIDGNLNGCFNYVGNVFNQAESTRIKFNITVSGGDLNGDGLTDIVIGQSTGGAEIRYQVSATAGLVAPVTNNLSIRLFPNPAQDHLQVSILGSGKNYSQLDVYDSMGRVVFRKGLTGNSAEVTTASWPAGVYLIQVTSGEKIINRRVTICH